MNINNPRGGAPAERVDTAAVEELFSQQSETVADHIKYGVKLAAMSTNSWIRILFEMRPEIVRAQQSLLHSYAEETKNQSLLRALTTFDPDIAQEVATIEDDAAEGVYVSLVNDTQLLETKMRDAEESLEYHRKAHETDLDHDESIDEYDSLIRRGEKQLAKMNCKLDMLQAIHYIPDEIRDKRFGS